MPTVYQIVVNKIYPCVGIHFFNFQVVCRRLNTSIIEFIYTKTARTPRNGWVSPRRNETKNCRNDVLLKAYIFFTLYDNYLSGEFCSCEGRYGKRIPPSAVAEQFVISENSEEFVGKPSKSFRKTFPQCKQRYNCSAIKLQRETVQTPTIL